MNLKKILQVGSLILLFTVLGVYSYHKTRDALFGVDLVVTGITNGETTTEELVTLDGVAAHTRLLSVNGQPISVDQQGKFRYSLLLQPGYNIVTIHTEDKFGKQKDKVFEVYYKQIQGKQESTEVPESSQKTE